MMSWGFLLNMDMHIKKRVYRLDIPSHHHHHSMIGRHLLFNNRSLNSFKMRLYSSVQLLGSTNPWSSTG